MFLIVRWCQGRGPITIISKLRNPIDRPMDGDIVLKVSIFTNDILILPRYFCSSCYVSERVFSYVAQHASWYLTYAIETPTNVIIIKTTHTAAQKTAWTGLHTHRPNPSTQPHYRTNVTYFQPCYLFSGVNNIFLNGISLVKIEILLFSTRAITSAGFCHSDKFIKGVQSKPRV